MRFGGGNATCSTSVWVSSLPSENDSTGGTYRSDLSAKKIKEVLVTNGLSQDEFSIKGQKDGILLDQPYSKGLTGISTIIKIERKSNSKK